MPPSSMTYQKWLLYLVASGLILRLGLWVIMEPQPFPDTGTYGVLAQQLSTGDFSLYDGRRTPGYPAFMLLTGFSPETLGALQMLAGLAASLCLFQLAFQATASAGFGFLAGMTYNLNLTQLFFESSLIPETFTTCFVLCGMTLLSPVSTRLRDCKHYAKRLGVVGLLAGAAIMLRPQFVFLPIVMGSYVMWILW